MKQIIHEDAIDRLKEQFTPEQMREISFALNPDNDDISFTLYLITEKSDEFGSDIEDLKERVSDLSKLIMDHKLIDPDEFIESLTCHVDDLELVVKGWDNE